MSILKEMKVLFLRYRLLLVGALLLADPVSVVEHLILLHTLMGQGMEMLLLMLLQILWMIPTL
jgi:hypothetical protein